MVQRIEFVWGKVASSEGKVTLLDTLGVEQETTFHTVNAQQLFTG